MPPLLSAAPSIRVRSLQQPFHCLLPLEGRMCSTALASWFTRMRVNAARRHAPRAGRARWPPDRARQDRRGRPRPGSSPPGPGGARLPPPPPAGGKVEAVEGGEQLEGLGNAALDLDVLAEPAPRAPRPA